MNCKTNTLRDAVVLALVVGAGGTAGAAVAQDASGSGATNLDRIEVTGSRIRQVDTETAQPVLLISRDQIEKQGFKSVADILQNIPTAGSPAVSRTSPLSSGEAVGGYYIDLRNLGASRTLVLVDGKRLGSTNGGLQDVSSIPAVAVERIEVLKDGASSIYGSDAIAGVINIITRKNFDGAEANAYVGQWGQGDGQRQVYDFMIGSTGERGSLTAGVEYTKEDPVWARDRWFSRTRFPTGEDSESRPGGLSGTSQYGRFAYRNGAGQTVTRTLRRDVPGLDPANINSYRALDSSDVSNPALASTVYSGIERKSAFLNGTFNFTDNIRFDTSVLYTDRESFAQNSGYPFNSANFVLSQNGLSADSVFNPVGNKATGGLPPGTAPQAVQYVRRGWEVPREVRNNLTTYRFTGAFSGSFELGEGKFWDWDAGYLYNQNKGVQVSTGNLNTYAVGLATGPSFINGSGVAQCGSAANPIALGTSGGNCTPWNPLLPEGYKGANGLSDPNVRAFLYQDGQAISKTETKNFFANISGSIVTLPAGDLGVAVGVEHRQESGSFSPDAMAQTGISTDLAAGPTRGKYSLDEVYAEFQVPLLANVAFAKELSLSLASRYSDYDNFGDTVNSKFGFKWKPIDSLLVRGTWAQGFRAPTIADLYGGLSQSFEYYTDPCDTKFGTAAGNARCAAVVPAGFRQLNASGTAPANGPGEQSNVPFASGSTPTLTPETSTSKTLGLVWSPEFVTGLNASLDWWKVRIENTIVSDDPTTLLEDCYLRGIASRCTGFTRNAAGNITALAFGLRNAGYQETEGYDLDVTYRFETAYGNFTAAWLSSYVAKNELKQDNSDTPPSQQNGYQNKNGSYFRLRSNLSLTWQMNDWAVTWSTRYYSSTKEQCYFDDRCSEPNFTAPEYAGATYPVNRIGANVFHDVQVSYNTPWNATIAVGANNVFEHYAAPSYSQPASGYSYYGGYDIGRFIYMKYQQRF
ncbi:MULTISPECIES: TonB-dependent receptor [Xanthomonas]|uniref:TonB-dependent receptor n=1 Tax=Xanthomonas sacchari TaxID=56458 RepID=A0AA46Q0E5_9XANT|nr:MULTISPECIES: TonB-dependent receptor [Xanthomonas]MCW0367952.1 Vitamin B12 transporter BtuB [Xanthomonas sacchari]MCW0373784.1 Vitamin B12 transporter BtuB [Xanthomonas sacchari]MCW0390291.1 Vitamin B12 transporter BtuB [Xanthomonas sacchari]MCW0442110.1 Vitamin B12 transporter BtuB [Xanthomonas sacchari]MCW0447398.1 Vitamin B12 transporter BtuB [Xanthomonas sacchari]